MISCEDAVLKEPWNTFDGFNEGAPVRKSGEASSMVLLMFSLSHSNSGQDNCISLLEFEPV